MDKETFKKIHNSVITEFPDKRGWHYQWFLDRVLDTNLSRNIRYGWFIHTVKKYLTENMKVVDIAGGFGMFGAYLQLVEGFNFDYTVIDLPIMNDVFNEYVKTLNFKGQFIIKNIRDPLQLKSETYDMAWLFSWCQIDGMNCETFFREVYNILKLGGILMFNMAYAQYAIKYSQEDLTDLMEKIGFEIVIIEKQSSFAPEFVVLAKKAVNIKC